MATIDEKRAWHELGEKELREELQDNHMWINAFSAINPSSGLKEEIGTYVLHKLNETTVRDTMGISKTALLRFNKS